MQKYVCMYIYIYVYGMSNQTKMIYHSEFSQINKLKIL